MLLGRTRLSGNVRICSLGSPCLVVHALCTQQCRKWRGRRRSITRCVASGRPSDDGGQGRPYDLIVSRAATRTGDLDVQVMCWAGPAGMLTGPHPVPGDARRHAQSQRKHVVWRLSAMRLGQTRRLEEGSSMEPAVGGAAVGACRQPAAGARCAPRRGTR
ncbi:uncharacterized protein CC84DRAFT_483319 [Paraphaeosphaeria sporulosa]|uniref:Uncharacterized protein n=1 Tax=Paraphaeosphaeria sporulosa TaxID=1460663 RepID=A0A177CT66_9PLEO|nr:uncharacterized protein CC84DRAFT_483319 [Paraphaeosphaeria sporulosa]OAG10391.1 hypothetical protein CC84DRAFT_483319 [Paraphaeosphaeria sporulosa]